MIRNEERCIIWLCFSPSLSLSLTCSPSLSLSLSPPLSLSFFLSLSPLSPFTSATRPVHHRFYVYCKSPCSAMRPGKLRVRCADCKDTSFVLLGVCTYNIATIIVLYTCSGICSMLYTLVLVGSHCLVQGRRYCGLVHQHNIQAHFPVLFHFFYLRVEVHVESDTLVYMYMCILDLSSTCVQNRARGSCITVHSYLIILPRVQCTLI